MARFAFLEVRPIHMPNQQSASRLASVARAAAAAAVAAMHVFCTVLPNWKTLRVPAALVAGLTDVLVLALAPTTTV